jgi:hypothetical protein
MTFIAFKKASAGVLELSLFYIQQVFVKSF